MTTVQTKLPENSQKTAQSCLERARDHFKTGDLAAAEDWCRKAVAAYPYGAEALFLLGTLLTRRGRGGETTDLFEKAVLIRPGYAPFRIGLGSHYLSKKRLPEAIAAFERALFLEPGNTKPYLSLALLYMAAGRAGEGVKTLAGAFGILSRGLVPGMALRLRLSAAGRNAVVRARILIRGGRHSKAIALLANEHETGAGSWESYDLLAAAYLAIANLSSARTAVEEGLSRYPAEPHLMVRHSDILCRFGRIGEAFATLEGIGENDRGGSRYQAALGGVFFRDNRAEKALAHLRAAEEEIKDDPDLYLLLGRCLAGLGRLEEAVPQFRKAIAVDKAFGAGFVALAKSGNLTPEDPCFQTLQANLANPFLAQANRFLLHLAAAHAYDQAGQSEPAFDHYQKGNALRDIAFSREAWSAFIDALIRTFSRAFVQKCEGFGSRSGKPIFIVGMPRSGTTLTEQILASHPKVCGAGEREIMSIIAQDFPKRFDPEPAWPEAAILLDKGTSKGLADEYLADLARIFPDAERVTDKMPGNFLLLGLIAILFPRANIIHCRRDPVDTCLSNYMQAYTTFHPYAFDLGHLGFYYREYNRLMAHWRKVFPGRILDLDYEKVIADPEKEARKLLKFCSLPWDQACLEFHKAKTTVQTSSFAQVRQPIYKTSSQKWKKYEMHLAPLLEALSGR